MPKADTDLQWSIASGEFVWSEEGLSPAHEYLLPSILRSLHQAGARVVLDLGCGNGALTHCLARTGYEVVGMDHSASGIAIASAHYPDLRFIQAGIDESLPAEFVERFDAVIAVEVIEHLLLPRQLFERAREALRECGTLLVSTPYHGYLKNLALALTNRFDKHWHPLRDYGHVKFFSPRTLSDLFHEQGFRVEQLQRLGRLPVLAKSMMIQGSLQESHVDQGRIV